MTQGHLKHRGLKLLAAIVASLPFGIAHAQPAIYDYNNNDDYTPQYSQTAPSELSQRVLEQDRDDLISARRRADDLAAQRDRVQQQIASIDNEGAVPAAAASSADAKTLQKRFNDAKANADKIHADAVAHFEQSDEWKTQFAKFDSARKDLKAPTDAVLNQLSQTHDFQALVNDAKAAKEKADKLHADKSADAKAVKDADAAFMAADNRVQDAAEKALSRDPQVVAGRKHVDEAKAKLDEMRDRFEQDLINDPSFGPAVAEVKAAKEALDAANGEPAAPAVAGELQGMTLAEAQGTLDQLNRDLDQARQDVDRLEDRVRQDEDATASAPTAPQDQGYGYNTPSPYAYQAPTNYGYEGYAVPDYGYGYGYDYGPAAYGVPVYSPYAAYDPYDYWCPGLSFGLSFDFFNFHHHHYDDWYSRWCRPYSYGRHDGFARGYGGYHSRSFAGSFGGRSFGHSNVGYRNSLGYYSGSRYSSASRSNLGSSRSNFGFSGGASRYGYSNAGRYGYSNLSRPSTISPRSGFSERGLSSRSSSRSSLGYSSPSISRSYSRSMPSFERSSRSSSSFFSPSRSNFGSSSRSYSHYQYPSFRSSGSHSSSFGSRSESFRSSGGFSSHGGFGSSHSDSYSSHGGGSSHSSLHGDGGSSHGHSR